MIDAMPRPRPPYLQREVTRHGVTVWYVRKGDGPRTRIKASYGSAEFMAAYHAAIEGRPLTDHRKAGVGTIEWLITRYRDTSAWRDMSDATRRQRDNIFENVIREFGDKPFAGVTKAAMVKSRDKRSATPAQARNFLDAMRGLFRWALEADHVKADPTDGVKNPKRQAGDGFPVWTEEDVDRYEAKWPVGTKERVWLTVLLYTGLRRGDAVVVGKQHIRDGEIVIKTEKSGKTVEVTIPVLPSLKAILDAGPTGDLAFIVGGRKEPLTKESFGNYFREACRKAGVNKSAHGVRKIGATRAANNGATVAELEAIFGWSGGGMAALYTRAADRKRLSRGAAGKLEKNSA